MQNETIELQTFNKRSKSFMLRSQYDLLKDFTLSIVRQYDQITLHELLDLAKEKFSKEFAGEVAWELLKTKQDLEVRGALAIRYEKSYSQVISLQRSKKIVSICEKTSTCQG